jgi:hypothetical protein
LPVHDLLFECRKIPRGCHSSDCYLIIFKKIEVVTVETEHLHSRTFVLFELEQDITPSLIENTKSLLHLGFLSGLICDFFDIFLVLSKF